MALLGENHVGSMPISRSESFGSGYYSYMEQSNCNTYYSYNNNNNLMVEKRQLFLRSYQFSRKKSLSEKIKRSLIRAKRVIWLRLRSARRFKVLVCFRLRHGLSYRRRRFLRLLNNYHYHNKCNNSYYFW